MTREEFVARFSNELTGLLLQSFVQASDRQKVPHQEASAASDGRFMIGQMKRARDLAERMYDEIKGKPAERNGVKA